MMRRADLLLAIPAKRSRSRARAPRRAQAVAAAIRSGRGADLFPPVVRACPEGVAAPVRGLGGLEDADRMAWILARPDFRPLLEMLDELDTWSERAAAR